MKLDSLSTDELLRLAELGDQAAIGRLFERYRGRLRRAVAARLDRRVAARLDPSDVVQSALGEASENLAEFVRERPVPFFAWLRRLALVHLSRLHRFHLGTWKRCAARDVGLAAGATVESTAAAVDRCPDTAPSPSQNAIRDEECERVQAVLAQMGNVDRTILELHYFERLSLAEIAERLAIGASAAKMRHLRALKRFRAVLEATPREPGS
jgi:RNA polymerase sigma-70 factor (ECF subfamily)